MLLLFALSLFFFLSCFFSFFCFPVPSWNYVCSLHYHQTCLNKLPTTVYQKMFNVLLFLLINFKARFNPLHPPNIHSMPERVFMISFYIENTDAKDSAHFVFTQTNQGVLETFQPHPLPKICSNFTARFGHIIALFIQYSMQSI